MHGMTAGAAFMCIANILQLMCSEEEFHIGACVSTLPPPIVPTLKQQTIPHLPYIDMLPWSSLRDRMLISPNTINHFEFVDDMGMHLYSMSLSIPATLLSYLFSKC